MENAGVFDDEKHVQYVANCADDLFLFIFINLFPLSSWHLSFVMNKDSQRLAEIAHKPRTKREIKSLQDCQMSHARNR